MPSTESQISLFLALLVATLYSATPLVLAGMGGVVSERAGVVNVALEGMMLTGAFAGIYFGQQSPIYALPAAVLTGGILGLLFGLLTQRAGLNPLVTGLALNLLVAGVTRYLSIRLFPDGVQTEGLPKFPFVVVAVSVPSCLAFALYHTRWGLRLRAVGSRPDGASTAGVSPRPVRLCALAWAGALTAFGGLYLSLAEAHTFTRDMSAGRGFIALAAVIVGKRQPIGTAMAALTFGFLYALQTQTQIAGTTWNFLGADWSSPLILDTLPYLISLLAVFLLNPRISRPKAIRI